MEQKIKAYKAFDKDLSCRGFKYEVGKEYEETGDIKVCEKGFYACPYPLDVFGYYPPDGARFCEVEQSGKINDSKSNKVCSSKIRIGAELDIRGLVKAAVSYVKERCTNECNAEPGKPATAGDSGAATAGYRGAATAGNYGPYPGIAICFQPRQERPSFFISELRGVFSTAHSLRLYGLHVTATSRASESREHSPPICSHPAAAFPLQRQAGMPRCVSAQRHQR